ncbi:FAD-dependent oxidoreductase [Zafaria sp. Z1313]|uniref:FAD-dependent oxidoreductase n=1 Tax=unclassified Zafaria TaxID=2828765 RepID=UPI002E7A30F4|nr:FAD-dependent oxidoreductase [Zafaria sp. J156]MEE1621006.1 FAD-dependent oxidoreductase [Zafaria sp. J156]
MTAAEHVVVIGFGPVAARLVEELLPRVEAGTLRLTVLGAEPHAAYNRVLVAEVGTGRATAGRISLADAGELTAAGVDVRLGTAVRRVDRSRRLVLLEDGGAVAYDRLVFATGARPVVPTLRGLDFTPHVEPRLPGGVVALRDLDDAGALLPVVRSGGRVVILGGGILGVEAALAVQEQGGQAVLVHHGGHPLSRALDDDAGRLLGSLLCAAGVEVVLRAKAVAVRHGAGFEGLELDDGTVVAGDLLVLSVGVRARGELAEGCGLVVERGIRVDRNLRADTEDRVFAIGDCAAVEGRGPSGLIGPGWTQAAWLAGYLAARPLDAAPPAGGPEPADDGLAPLPPEPAAVLLLKARGIDLSTGGDPTPGPWHEGPERVAVWADPRAGRYCKMVTRDGVLTGFTAIGMPRTAAELVLLYERGTELPADRSTLFRLDDAGAPAAARPAGPGDVLCRCSGATHGEVAAALDAGCATVEEVGSSCRAGTGCGGCKEQIEAMLRAAAPLPA